MRIINREHWLAEATRKLVPLFKQAGYELPANIRCSCGWPSTRALSTNNRRIGEAWSHAASKDGHYEVLISPSLYMPHNVLDVLVHELVHCAVGLECGHKGAFKKCATAVGLTGKMTSTVAGPELVPKLILIADQLGPYPHGALDGTQRPTKKQSTRLLKCECPDCGYIARVTAKWIEAAGAPICPADDVQMIVEDKED